MGVYLCLGQHHHGLTHDDAIYFSHFKNFQSIQTYVAENEKYMYSLVKVNIKLKRKQNKLRVNLLLNKLKNNIIKHI